MKQQELQEKAEKIQEERIREMEHVITHLEEENAMLEKRAWEYLKTMRQMLDDIHS